MMSLSKTTNSTSFEFKKDKELIFFKVTWQHEIGIPYVVVFVEQCEGVFPGTPEAHLSDWHQIGDTNHINIGRDERPRIGKSIDLIKQYYQQ